MEDLEDLYENAPCGYLSLAFDGVIMKANRTLCTWLGANSYELLGKRFYDLLNVPGKIFYETHFAPLLRMQGYFNEVALDLVDAGGKKIPVLANAHERRASDGSLMFTRITLFQAFERRKYERELVEATRAADEAKQELETVNAALERRIREGVMEQLRLHRGILAEKEVAKLREQFVAILGHDLRNPLSSIVGGLNMLAKEPQTEKSNRVLSLMRGSTDRMFSLINDMLDFARLKSGAGMEVRLSSTDLRPVLEQVVNELRTAHPHRVIESEMALPDRVDCDPARIAQLVSNLLSNAITHGSKEGPVRLDACVQGEELIIKVANDGNRIPTEIQSRLFQPFFRAGTSGKGGLGLGLFIANEIATRHSGRMEVHSNDAETAFCLVMPATA